MLKGGYIYMHVCVHTQGEKFNALSCFCNPLLTLSIMNIKDLGKYLFIIEHGF
jgi:hypothetical protein